MVRVSSIGSCRRFATSKCRPGRSGAGVERNRAAQSEAAARRADRRPGAGSPGKKQSRTRTSQSARVRSSQGAAFDGIEPGAGCTSPQFQVLPPSTERLPAPCCARSAPLLPRRRLHPIPRGMTRHRAASVSKTTRESRPASAKIGSLLRQLHPRAGIGEKEQLKCPRGCVGKRDRACGFSAVLVQSGDKRVFGNWPNAVALEAERTSRRCDRSPKDGSTRNTAGGVSARSPRRIPLDEEAWAIRA